MLPPAIPVLEGRSALVITRPFVAESIEETTLVKMMAACKLSKDQYAVIQLRDGDTIAWQALRRAGSPPVIVLLGVAPAQLGIAARFAAHEPVSFLGSKFLWSFPLAQIAEPEIKKKLWDGGLKPLFGLK